MKRKLLLAIGAVLLLSATAITGYKLGERGASDSKTSDLEKRLMELSEKLRETQQKYQVDSLLLSNAKAELRKYEAAESAIKEDYKFENIESRMASIKLNFNDLQREVADGKFPGLALTPAYQELRQIFDNPEFDRLVRVEHTRD